MTVETYISTSQYFRSVETVTLYVARVVRIMELNDSMLGMRERSFE